MKQYYSNRLSMGPLVRAVLFCDGDKVTVLPGAVAPEGAGAADEPWEEPEW